MQKIQPIQLKIIEHKNNVEAYFPYLPEKNKIFVIGRFSDLPSQKTK